MQRTDRGRPSRVQFVPSGLAVALAFTAVFADEPARWLVVVDPPGHADAALVLAGDLGYERTKHGARMVLEGEARLLIVTGGEPWGGDSAESLRQQALSMGVPRAAIRLEATSSNTHESMLAILPILVQERIRRLAVVTSPYHQRRAVWAARRTLRGVEILSRPADAAGWRPEGWWKSARNRRIVLGEYVKLGYYILRGWA